MCPVLYALSSLVAVVITQQLADGLIQSVGCCAALVHPYISLSMPTLSSRISFSAMPITPSPWAFMMLTPTSPAPQR